ncbi:MAG: glycoside hydrolase family 3 protein [Cellulophaga sp.]
MNNIIPFQKAKNKLTSAEKVGQLFMPAAFINDTEEEILLLENSIKKHHIGGLCFFHSRASAATNFEGKKKVIFNTQSHETLKGLIKRYQKTSKYPLLISIDAEWGLAMRIENTPQYPYCITLGAIQNNDDLIYKVGKNIAKDCKQSGIHWNFSPVVDINNNPNNPVIGYRSFGENKTQIVAKATAFINGTNSEGILTSIKHFPGHGDTATDSHLGLPIITKTKEELLAHELLPFQKIIDYGIDAVMVGHLAVPALSNGKNIPASISKDIIKGILRSEMNFKGLVVSDALNMHSVSKMYPTKGELEWLAFDAGNDILCFTENITEGVKTILEKAEDNQIEESFERIWKLKERAINNAEKDLKELINPDSLNTKLAQKSLTLLKEELSIANFIKEEFSMVTIGKKSDTNFSNSIREKINFATFSTKDFTIEELKNELQNTNNIVLSLFPPQIKPSNNFEIGAEELEYIQELIQTKNVVFYLFGNPYVLNLFSIKKVKTVVVVYQDFEVFQKNAAQHFLGNAEAKGKLPVTIN